MTIDPNLFRSEFADMVGQPNEAFLQRMVDVYRKKRGPTITRSIREFGEVKSWDLQTGIWCNPRDPRFNAVILIGSRSNKELIHGITFSGMVITLDKLVEVLGNYEVGVRQEDKSAAFIFTMNDSNAWIGAFEFNVRRRKFEKMEDGKLIETLETGEQVEVNPAELSMNVFTVHFVEPPGREELMVEEERSVKDKEKYAGMSEEEIAEAKRQEKLERVKRLTKLKSGEE